MFKEDLANKQLWQKRIREWSSSGLSMVQWCEQHHCSYKAFKHRKYKYRGGTHELFLDQTITTSSFIELSDNEQQSGYIELRINNITVCLREGFDPELLKSTLQVLRSI